MVYMIFGNFEKKFGLMRDLEASFGTLYQNISICNHSGKLYQLTEKSEHHF